MNSGVRNGQAYNDDIIFERETGRRKARDERVNRRRSLSNRRVHAREELDIADEAEYYNRRVSDRAYMGEAYNGATRDWAIVDVPPGTKRVTMDGIGGGSQEITWQRYNGVRRSKFITEGDEYGDEIADRGRRFVGAKSKQDNMWTEITKDLVVKEALEEMGYDFEETEFFYYVIEYLRYVRGPRGWVSTLTAVLTITSRRTSFNWLSYRKTSAGIVANAFVRSSGSEKG